MTTYLLAGGGTAGHVTPLLAVADALRVREPDSRVLVLGTAEGLEARLVPAAGYELLTIAKVPFPRRPNRYAAAFPSRFRAAVAQVRQQLRARGVDVLVGFGGYASAPAYVAARRERVPFVVHEANARPGLANVLGARRAAAVGVAFAGTRLRRAEAVGMPLRRSIAELDRAARRGEAATRYGLDAAVPTLLVFGGSLGAQRLNEAFSAAAGAVLNAGWQLVHITGERWQGSAGDAGRGRAVLRYEDRMEFAFSIADVVVARAGAATVSELSALGIPAVYVPYAVGNGEQALNARAAVAAGAAVLIPDAELDADCVRERIVPLLTDPARLAAMTAAARVVGSRSGTENLLALIDRALTGGPGGAPRMDRP